MKEDVEREGTGVGEEEGKKGEGLQETMRDGTWREEGTEGAWRFCTT